MSGSVLPFGSEIALTLPISSETLVIASQPPTTIGDLLSEWETKPARDARMFRVTCARLGDYLQMPVEEITLEAVVRSKSGFRPFLVSRKYAENSIRTYVSHVRMILYSAEALGWSSASAYPEAWRPILKLVTSRKCKTFVQYLATCHRSPEQVTVEDANRALCNISQKRLSYDSAIVQRTEFWRMIRDLGYPNQLPTAALRENDYGIPIDAFPDHLKQEVQEILKWKQAVYAVDRPKKARHRPGTSKRLGHIISMVYGFGVNIQGRSDLVSLEALMKRDLIGGYVEWCLNERQVQGQGLRLNLRLFAAIFNQHPRYKEGDWSWVEPMLDSIPMEPESSRKKRKASKYLDYASLEAIPEKIRATRTAEKNGSKRAALLARDELLIKWLTILPWRQRNIRECRIAGAEPNVFKAPMSDIGTVELPRWATEARQKDPKVELWQFHFTEGETKTGCEIHAIVPHQLIPLLEEYLTDYRPYLCGVSDPGTLFLNGIGAPMNSNAVTDLVSQLTLRYGGRRVTPHIFRDIVAYTWLMHHPQDYLTLSKHLWHSGPTEVIRTYGSRFNESSGVVMMEAWLAEREGQLGP
jgi:integrase